MNSSTGVDQSVVLGAEQKPIWCYEGIDLYVSLQLDCTESARVNSLSPWPSSDGPGPVQVYPQALVTPPADVVKESSGRAWTHGVQKHREIAREDFASRFRAVEKPSSSQSGPGDFDHKLDGEVLPREGRVLAHTGAKQILGKGKKSGRVEARRSVPGVAVRRFMGRFDAPLAVQRDQLRYLNTSAQLSSGNRELRRRNDRPVGRSSEDDLEKVCDLEDQCRQCKYESSARGNVVSKCRCLAVSGNIGNPKSSSEDDLEDQPTHQIRRGDGFYSCNENRSWTPDGEDYSWVPVDMSRDTDNRLSGCCEGSTDFVMQSSVFSSKDTVGRILQHEHNRNPSLATFVNRKFPELERFYVPLLPSKVPDIESFDVADILAACQLVKISALDCRKNFSEQEMSTMKGRHVHILESKGESSEDGPSRKVEKMYPSPLPHVDVSNSRKSLQPGVGKLYLSPRSDEDRYIPRIARRARGRLRGSQFSTRIDFVNTEVDELHSGFEVLRGPPRKRQYKSTQELLLA